MFNFIADDYRMLLKKLVNLVPIFPPTLKFLILYLPQGCANVDFYYARRIQEQINRLKKEDLETCVLFIQADDHKKLVNQFWSISKFGEGLVCLDTVQTPVYMQASISESTLIYSWGSSTHGQLGNGVRDWRCDEVSGFVREDMRREATTISELYMNQWFTWQPQAIVTLLGRKIRKVQAGKQHFLALSSTGKIYTWGDNSKSQLGLDTNTLNSAGGEPEDEEVTAGVDYMSDSEDQVIKCASIPCRVTTKPSQSSAS